MTINYQSKLPLYYQLREELKKSILEGKLKEGDLIASERELSETYNLSSTTVRRALNDLVQENMLERKAGKGTFVRFKSVKRDLRKVLSFTNNMKEMGLVPSSVVLEKKIVLADELVRESLNVKEGTKVFRLERLRLANEIPMMLETRYIRMDFCPGIMEQDLSGSLWKVFENKYGHKPYRHSQTVGIAKVSRKSASLLGIKNGSVVYSIKGITFLKNGQAIECDESLYRSDKYELTFEAIAD